MLIVSTQPSTGIRCWQWDNAWFNTRRGTGQICVPVLSGSAEEQVPRRRLMRSGRVRARWLTFRHV